MLSTKEVSKKLNVSTTTIKRWVKTGKLKSVSNNKNKKFQEEDLNLFVKNNSEYLQTLKRKQEKVNVGDVFGRLKVVKIITPALNECVCECGKSGKIVSTTRLKKGIIKRCSPKCSLDKGNSIANILYRDYVRQGNKHGRKFFFLTKEETLKLFKGDCFYCGSPPSRVRKIERLHGSEYIYNGIDRIDSSKNYTKDNVVSCCSKCNFMKHELSIEEFKMHIIKIYNHLNSKNEKT